MSHWTTHPALDPRAVPLSARGIRAPGHHGTPETCTHPACVDDRTRSERAQRAIAQKRGSAGAAASKRAAERAGVTHVELCGGAAPSTREPSPPHPQPSKAPTVREVILLAAVDVAAHHAGAVPLGSLVVRAWELAPERFGLPGLEKAHPHSSRVLAKLAGTEGLVALGWLDVAGPSAWKLTTRGARLAREIRRRAA